MNDNGAALICAVRGPVLLITLGTLFAIDHMGSFSFTRTWPVLLIVLGVLKLMERSALRTRGGTELP